jgi:hypothetical protein
MNSLGHAASPRIPRNETVWAALLLAFMVSVVIAAWLHRSAGDRAGTTSMLIEILLPVVLLRCEAQHNQALI